MKKAILVQLQVAGQLSTMTASCMGEDTLEYNLRDLPAEQPAYALARIMCHKNRWPDELVYGLLPNGDEVFCFRAHDRG